MRSEALNCSRHYFILILNIFIHVLVHITTLQIFDNNLLLYRYLNKWTINVNYTRTTNWRILVKALRIRLDRWNHIRLLRKEGFLSTVSYSLYRKKCYMSKETTQLGGKRIQQLNLLSTNSINIITFQPWTMGFFLRECWDRTIWYDPDDFDYRYMLYVSWSSGHQYKVIKILTPILTYL